MLATTQLDLNYVRNEILPSPHDIAEGSMWDLVLPSAPTWLVQANRAYHVDVFAWLTRNDHDQRSGIRATTTRATDHVPPHSVYVQLQLGQVVTVLSRPFWCWYDKSTR